MSRLPEDDHSDTCSMCGKFCAVRSMNKALAGEACLISYNYKILFIIFLILLEIIHTLHTFSLYNRSWIDE